MPSSLNPAGAAETAIRQPTPELKIYYALLLTVLVVILVPIWIVKYPGLVDFPNHLTRCYILAHYHENPIWQQRFVLSHDPIPNLAVDLVVAPLLRLLPLMVCGRMFLTLSAVLYVVGCSEVGRAVTGRPNWLALACAFTFYNSSLLDGFVNYVFGIGIFLCVFAFWLRVRNAMSPLRFLLCCLLSIVSFLAHLSSVVILGAACLTIALLEFVRDRKILRLIVSVVWLACPVLLMAGFLKGGGRVGRIVWTSPLYKLTSLAAPIRSYSVVMDVGAIVVLIVCALVILRGSRIHPAAVAALVLFALFLITPGQLFTGFKVDTRYVVPGYLLLLLSIEPRWGRWQRAAMALALITMAVHMGSIAANWFGISRRSEQVLAMGRVLPMGARVYAVQPIASLSTIRDRGFLHIIQFWTLSHQAYISSFFADPGQQPLVSRKPPCHGPPGPECFASYDYVWTYDPPSPIRQELLHIATPAATWEKVTLWRVNRKTVIGS